MLVVSSKWSRAGGCAGSNYPFLTSKERDIETNLDYFLARYYSSMQGRFTSPDEFTGGPDELYNFAHDASENPTFYAEVDNPQSLNKYQYTYNNPLNMTDDDGHCPVCAGAAVALEVGGTALDLNETRKTLQDPNASKTEKVLTTVATAAGIFFPGGGYGALVKGIVKGAKREATEIVVKNADEVGETVGDLRKAGKQDAHHTIQDAAVKDVPAYKTNEAPGVQLPGPPNKQGTPHQAATSVQRQRGGGTYASERRIGYKALRRAGISKPQARESIRRADNYFRRLGVTPNSPTRVPKNRR